MMSILVLTCTLSGADCHHSVVATGVESQIACMTRGQAQVAAWLGERPERRLEKFICVKSRDVPRVLSLDGRA